MGRWSAHPMASDTAMDAVDDFEAEAFKILFNRNFDYEKDHKSDLMEEMLKKLSYEQLSKAAMATYCEENQFVIPFLFLDYNIKPRKELYPLLKGFLECHDDFYDDSVPGEICQKFKMHFEEIFNGKYILNITEARSLFEKIMQVVR